MIAEEKMKNSGTNPAERRSTEFWEKKQTDRDTVKTVEGD